MRSRALIVFLLGGIGATFGMIELLNRHSSRIAVNKYVLHNDTYLVDQVAALYQLLGTDSISDERVRAVLPTLIKSGHIVLLEIGVTVQVEETEVFTHGGMVSPLRVAPDPLFHRFLVDRVKVLNGRYSGRDGWVLDADVGYVNAPGL